MDDTASIADSVDSLGESMVENSKFYFQGQKLLLTYKTQLHKEDLIDFIKEEAKLELQIYPMCPRSRRHGLRAYARSDRLRQKVLLQEPPPLRCTSRRYCYSPKLAAYEVRDALAQLCEIHRKAGRRKRRLIGRRPKDDVECRESAKPYGEYLVM